ncbi:60S ribosomal protein-like protein L6 [Dothidotthia symphoricarpi CBS 119687]|uniref:60S ribosomal protein L6 n=1 Tax=Dothidotthia symphoricarpi CBS 119687 TaxID=1392245 RepID=A0A6A6ACN9_9PLEO|nr:60S ribosomal protein-like protein L6 [Dothidotthia symphoricarpi CBS 119687]KAF2129540.1 60S ribosomal protein-like protein L6 [Dothidotthia symphoricarpi CBS 119687]
MADTKPTTQKFSKGERSIPHASQKASKYYPATDVAVPKKTRKTLRPAKPRASLEPGSVVILLAGRFRGKRVVLLKHLPQGVLLVTGPFKVNGVPLRRVNARYVIATSTKVNVEGVDEDVLKKASEDGYFTKDKASRKPGEDSFFKQGEKPEKKETAKDRVEDQKAVDKALLATIKKEAHLADYLGASFSLRSSDRPHQMVF